LRRSAPTSGNGSALEVVLHDYALYKSTFTLLYFTLQNLYRRIPSRFVSRHSLVTIPFHSVAFHISTTCGPISPAVARDSVCSRLRRDWLDPNSRHKRSSKSCGRATFWIHTISSTRNQNRRRTNLPISEIFQRKCVFITVAALTVKQLKHILSVSQLF